MIILESKTRNTSRSIKWGIINKVASIVLPFAVRTTIIYFLGIEYAGLGSLFTSILSVLSLAELGFSSAIVFSMYKPVAENDIAKVNAYLNFYRRCYRIIGSIVLIIGLVLMPFIPYLINGGYPADINIYVLYCIYLFNTVISYFLFAYKRSIFSVTQRNDIISNISTILLILADFVQIGLLCLFRNYYAYIVIILVMTIANNVILAVCAKRIYPEIKGEGEITKDEKRIIYQKLNGLIYQKIGEVILGSVDTIVISAYMGLEILAIYNNYYYIISALFGFFAVIQTSLIPSVGNSMHLNSVEKNYSDFQFFHFLYIVCNIFCAACLLPLYQPFIRIWVGERYMLEMPLVVLLTIYFYTYKISDICSIYKFASGLWDKWKMVPMIAGVVNLVFNLALSYFWGLYGIIISSIISILGVYLPFYCFPLFKYYFKSVSKFWHYINTQFMYMMVAAIIIILTYYSSSFIKGNGILLFLIKGLLTASVAFILLVLFISFTKFKERLICFIKRIIKAK